MAAFDVVAAGDGGVAGASFAAEEVFDEDAARFVVLFVAVVVDLPAFVPAEVEPAAFEPVDFPAAAFEPVDFPAAAFVPSDLEPADFVPADFEAADFVAALFVLELLVPVDLVPEDVAPEDVPLELAAEAAERVVPLPAFRDREPVRAGASAAVGCALSSSGAEAAARAAAERRPPLLPVRPRRSAAARAIPVARSRAPARSRWAFSSSRETCSPEKNMSTGRTPPASPSEPAVGRVRVRSSCSGAGVEPAPGIRAPSPRPSPRFCVMAVVLPRKVSPSGCPRVVRAPSRHVPWNGGQGAGREFSSCAAARYASAPLELGS
ncbi:MAG TPA: hypothetical protein VK122_11620 [Brachybacterium sp.]|nr:hypothetical protein [Brachybacterium sp.]